MPIPIAEWNNGRDSSTTEAKIIQFLSNNKGKAFTTDEIADNIPRSKLKGNWDIVSMTWHGFEVRQALKKLVEEGTVKSKDVKKKIGSDTYYTIT